MDRIIEYPLYRHLTEQSYTIKKNSQILSARICPDTNNIVIDVLVDLDNNENINKDFLLYTQNDLIADNMKANFIGSVNDGEMTYYVFEKIR
jgi:hypothetical protein